jgi:TPR repeat protein
MNIVVKSFLLLGLMVIPFSGYSKEKEKKKTGAVEKAPPIADSEEKKAFRETLKKAEMGDPSAQCEIGAIYAGGNSNLGIKADRKLGRAWYQKAANQNYQPVYHTLSMFHAMGANFYQAYGLNQSDEIAESIKWALLSRNTESYPSLAWAFGKMSESTKVEGERRAKEFRAEQAKKNLPPVGK